MTVIAPNTDLILLKVPLEIDEANQLTFANATAQYNYFNGLTGKLAVDKYTYQRKDGTIRFGANFDDIIGYNYVMYRNTSYSNKWFYAFIVNKEYLGNNVTAISIKTDPYQTWMFELSYKPSLIEREHANTDVVGDNLLPEGLEYGEYISNGSPVTIASLHKMYIINADKAPATDINGQPTNPQTTYYSANIGGVPMAGNLFMFHNNGTLTNAILTYSRMDGGLDHIKQVYVSTSLCTDSNEFDTGDYQLDEFAYEVFKGTSTPKTTTLTTAMPTTIDGYTPHNQKLLTSPFQYLILSNNNGTANILNYEYFTDKTSIKVDIRGIPVVGGSIYAYPKNYKGETDNYNEGIVGGKLPTLSWSGDAYTNWLTLNAVNIRNEVIGDVATVIGGVAVGAITGGAGGALIAGGAVVSGVKSAHEIMQEQREHKKLPNTFSGNINAGDVITSLNDNKIYLYKMSITAQFAQLIDRFFDKFGYKTNKIKLPNITGRRNWNYVKTVGCYIDGDIPQSDLQEIKSMFDKGVTFWHNASTFGDYSQNNDII